MIFVLVLFSCSLARVVQHVMPLVSKHVFFVIFKILFYIGKFLIMGDEYFNTNKDCIIFN